MPAPSRSVCDFLPPSSSGTACATALRCFASTATATSLSEIAELGAPAWPFKDRGVPDSTHGRMLPFMVENQGVCTWGIALDDADDPPVLVAVDPAFQWRPHAASFSTFIACQVWDYEKVQSRCVVLAAEACKLAPHDLKLLRRQFHEGPTTHGWPTENIFRSNETMRA